MRHVTIFRSSPVLWYACTEPTWSYGVGIAAKSAHAAIAKTAPAAPVKAAIAGRERTRRGHDALVRPIAEPGARGHERGGRDRHTDQRDGPVRTDRTRQGRELDRQRTGQTDNGADRRGPPGPRRDRSDKDAGDEAGDRCDERVPFRGEISGSAG